MLCPYTASTYNMKEKIFVGVAWPYANGSLHLGHIAGCYLPADIFARYCRLKDKDVLMVSGSDEHGTPITITAENENTTPQKIVDKFHEEHKQNMIDLGISFDLFTRTSTENHKKIVQNIFLKLYEKGDIYRKTIESFYCENCNRFLPDRYIEGICPNCGYDKARGDQCDECGNIFDSQELKEVKCKICGGNPKLKETEHLFFALSKYESKLVKWIENKKYWKASVNNFTKNWLKDGLKDRAISRDINWGVKIPIEGFENKRIYVWFDAVIGYLSASQMWATENNKVEKWKEWWNNKNSKHYYFLAKDNIPFHSLIWPSILMSYDNNLELPYDIPANEYLRLDGEQFSKSRGFAIWVPDIIKKLDVDALRYYLSINMPENRDTNWIWKDFVAKNNDELVGAYGNFVHRVITFTQKNFGEIPDKGKFNDLDEEALEKIKVTSEKVSEYLDKCHFKKALRSSMNLAQYGNQYFNQNEPWKLIKENKERCKTVLHISLKIINSLAVFMSPFLPFSSEKIWKLIGYEKRIHNEHWDSAFNDLKVGKGLERPKPLFKKLILEEFMAEEDPFSKLDLRVAKVLDVKDHPQADKLYLIHVDLGPLGKRVIVAGMKPYYSKDEMKGKNIVIVSNLKPANIRGVKSNGMLLAATDKKGVCSLLNPGDADPGSEILVKDIKKEAVKLLEFDDFKKVNMIINEEQKAIYNNKTLQGQRGDVTSDKDVDKGAKIS